MGIVFISLSNIFGLYIPVYVRKGLDAIATDPDVAQHVAYFCMMVIVFAILKGVNLFFVRQTIIVMSRKMENDIKNEIYAHYQTLPLQFYRTNNTGDLMARISEDVSKVRMYLGPAVMYGLNLIVMFAIYLPYMASTSMKLTLWTMLPLPFLSVSIYFVSSRISKRSEEIQRSLSDLSTFVQEAFSGIRVLKSFTKEETSAQEFDKESENYRQKSLKLALIQAFFLPLIMSLIGLSVVLAIYVGGQEVIAGNLTIGNIVEFILYVTVLTWPVTSLGWITSLIQRAAASQQRINEFLNTKTTLVSDKNIEKEIKGTLVFDHVTYTYPESGITAIKDFSLEVKEGESIGIVGATGSGKSSIANAICRLFDPTSGDIQVDDISLKDYDLSCLRSQMGVVPQDVFLFSDTIRNNIAFGNSTRTGDGQIEQAAKDAGVYKNIIAFKEGFETRIGERGITLSGGQKQRVSIARAIIREPKILIFDDCLSAVDTETENEILGNMKRIMQGKTSIVISHRVSSVKIVDRIVVIDDGQMVEQGSHDELMAQKGKYFELWEKQMEVEEA